MYKTVVTGNEINDACPWIKKINPYTTDYDLPFFFTSYIELFKSTRDILIHSHRRSREETGIVDRFSTFPGHR